MQEPVELALMRGLQCPIVAERDAQTPDALARERRVPVRHWNSRPPSANTSTLASIGALLRACSGAM